MDLKAVFNEFKSQVAFTLFLIWLLAVWHSQPLNSILYPLISVFLMTLLDIGITWVRSKKLYWPSASFVTGLLIGLIIDPKEPIWIIALAVLAAFVSKQFIGAGLRQHIFNPAAFGIMTVTLAFGAPVAWWAVAWGKLPLIILVPAMLRILWRMKRLWLAISFLFVYLVYYLTLFDPQAAVLALVDGSLLLFALVMLSEPITSPAVGNYKYLFGPAVAIISIGLSRLNLAEVFLPALLVANLTTFSLRFLNKKRV
ncbi:MAG: RnfABCDGE type electron transport complex subunit D [Patescibacteria group bacterium]